MSSEQQDPHSSETDWVGPVLTLIIGAIIIVSFAIWAIGQGHREAPEQSEGLLVIQAAVA